MTRVHHERRPQRVLHGGGGMPLDQPRAALKKKKPYKIVLEAVTQEKKKLHSILTYASNAPDGFGFVPAGHPEFTEWCKEQCRQRNLDVHIVSAKPKNKMHADPAKLSHHVHRVGHHFPLEIVTLACSKFGYVYDEAHGLREDKSRRRTNWIAQGVEDYSSRQLLQGRPSTEKESKEQTRGAVREMFPKIPEADLESIISHAFEKGTTRVGNATELPLARRVQLAVVAHIRHVYTDYDKRLKTGTWMQARQNVEHVSLAKLKEWRDETGERSNEIEDTFREVIVLDDDDDESSDDDSLSTPDEREQSMEIVSNRATARDLQPERHSQYPRTNGRDRRLRRTIRAQPYVVSRPASLHAPLHGQPLANHVSDQPTQRVLRSSVRPPVRHEALDFAPRQPIDPRARPPPSYPTPRTQPLIEEIEGQMYHVSLETVEPPTRENKVFPPNPLFTANFVQLEPIREPYVPPRYQHQYEPPLRTAPSSLQSFVPALPEVSSRRPVARFRQPSEQDVVLPSVERETVDLHSPRRGPHQPVTPVHPASREQTAMQAPKRLEAGNFRPNWPELERKRSSYHQNDPGLHAGALQSVHPLQADKQDQFRAKAPHEYIDLTSSPRRPPPIGGNGYHAPVHAHAVPASSGRSYVPAAPPSPILLPYYDPAPHGYVPNGGIHERRGSPARDYMPLREEHRRPVEGGLRRYQGSALPYGGPDLR